MELDEDTGAKFKERPIYRLAKHENVDENGPDGGKSNSRKPSRRVL